SYFIWLLGVVPLPAFKSLAVLSVFHLLCSLIWRIPFGVRSVGLYMIHGGLLVLLLGSLIGSEIKGEYVGFSMDENPTVFFDVGDETRATPVAVAESFAYVVRYQGEIQMGDKSVEMYQAFYDPFHFVPYLAMVMFIFGAALHYVLKCRKKIGGGGVLNSVPAMAVAVLPLLASTFACSAETPSLCRALPAKSALVVLEEGVRPYDSFARGVLDDFSGKVRYSCGVDDSCNGKLEASAVVGQIQKDVECRENVATKWNLFKVLRSDVLEVLDLPKDKRYVSYEDLLHVRERLQFYASREDDHPTTIEMKRLYGNVLTFEGLQKKQLQVLSSTNRSEMEVLYHKLNFSLAAFIFAFFGTFASALNLFLKKKRMDVMANVALGASAVTLTVALVLRFYIADRVPLANLYEIVLAVSLMLLAFLVLAFAFCRKRTFALVVPVAAMATAMLFFAKFILEPGDTFRSIPAVLNSSAFLTLHVFTIALGFAGMILSGVVAHVALWRECCVNVLTRSDELNNIRGLLYGTLVFGAAFTIAGTLLGGVWADFAWGRFWGFDPKECGALFVCLWGMLLLHLRGGNLVAPKNFALLNCFNVAVTFLCWFGINLLGVGLHSYGFEQSSVLWLTLFTVADVLVIFSIYKLKI
ncbi:MAG: cytochrome c biogenesis protein CcsA, partial [Fibrobacter sp.]|nr:cytochrome c biogenesis protein CcsA [Fibrobacter sp.]